MNWLLRANIYQNKTEDLKKVLQFLANRKHEKLNYLILYNIPYELRISKIENPSILALLPHLLAIYDKFGRTQDLLELILLRNFDKEELSKIFQIKPEHFNTPLNGKGDTALMLLAKKAYSPSERFEFVKDTIIENLLKSGNIDGNYHNKIDVNRQNKYGQTALSKVCSNTVETVVAKLLIAAGANVNLPDINGNTPLMMACLPFSWLEDPLAPEIPAERAEVDDRSEMAKILIHNGANVNAKNNKQQTALMLAAAYRADKVLQVLLEQDAEINAQDKDGRTALMYACTKTDESIKIISILLKNNANPLIKNLKGYTALELLAWTKDNPHKESMEPIFESDDIMKESDSDDWNSKLNYSLTRLQNNLLPHLKIKLGHYLK